MTDVQPTNNGFANTGRRAGIEEIEHNERAPFILTFAEVKLLGIAGVSSLDANHCPYR